MITLTPDKWHRLRNRLLLEHPPSTLLIRDKMRRELGFTVREDNSWHVKTRRYRDLVHLDFFDDRLESWFVLKYAEHL
jgi:hypothetical protein